MDGDYQQVNAFPKVAASDAQKSYREAIDRENARYKKQIKTILKRSASKFTVTPDMAAENTAFLEEWNTKKTHLNPEGGYKLNAFLHEHKKHMSKIDKIYEHHENQNELDKVKIQEEKAISKYRGIEAGFEFVAQIGMATKDKVLHTIGTIGAAGASIALNTALITGSITVNGAALTGWGLALPAFGIGMAALTIITTVLAKRKDKKDPHMEAMIKLGELINQWGELILERIDIFEERVHQRLRAMADQSAFESALIKTALSDEFNAVTYKIDDIQDDLNRLTDITKKSMSATYMEKFYNALSMVAQYVKVKGDRTLLIEAHLFTLTTWLTDINYIKNTNATWCVPDRLNADNVFSQKQLRHHDALLDGPLESRLGYIGTIASLIPDVTFNNVDVQAIPNTALLTEGVDSYVNGRLHIGMHASSTMDPDSESLSKIQDVARNGLQFMQQLSAQEFNVLNGIASAYEKAYHQLCQSLQEGARTRLLTGTVPGFEFLKSHTISQTDPWPTHIQHSTSGPGLPFDKMIAHLMKHQDLNRKNQKNELQINLLIRAALALDLGKITATYTPIIHNAGTAWRGSGHNWHQTIVQFDRSVTWNIQISYTLKKMSHTLFSIEGSTSEKILYNSSQANGGPEIRSKDWEAHNRINGQQQANAAAINRRDPNPLLIEAWADRTLLNPPTEKTKELSDALKAAIINGIVAKCITAPDHTYPQERMVISSEILADKELLNDIPKDLTLLKKLLIRFGALLNTPVMNDILALWDEEQFKANITNYHQLQKTINMLNFKNRSVQLKTQLGNMRGTTDHVRPMHPITYHMYYCAHLLATFDNYQSTIGFTAISNMAESLQVDARVVFEPGKLECNLIKENYIAKGSFGKVYRGTYKSHPTDKLNGTPLAVKVLFSNTTFLGGEMETLTRLKGKTHQSRYLTTIYGVTIIDEFHALVMEFVPNRTLEHNMHIKNPSLPIDQRIRIACEIATGIEFLHSEGIIHGDLKPENILMTNDNHIKISDFGLSRIANHSIKKSNILPTQEVIGGTIPYQAPEMFGPKLIGKPTEKADVYAMGVIFYELLTNQRPFQDLEGGYSSILIYWVREKLSAEVEDYFFIPEPDANNPACVELHTFLAPIIPKCREINPEKRLSSSQVIEAMRMTPP